MGTVILHHGSGAGDFSIVDAALSEEAAGDIFLNVRRLLSARDQNDALSLLEDESFAIYPATNDFNDEFHVLFATVPLERYEWYKSVQQDLHVYARQLADTVAEADGPYIRFVAIDLELEKVEQLTRHLERMVRVEFHHALPDGFDAATVVQRALDDHPCIDKWRARAVDIVAIARGKVTFRLVAGAGHDEEEFREDFRHLEEDLTQRFADEITEYNTDRLRSGAMPFLESGERQTLFEQLHDLKGGLKDHATGGAMDYEDYRSLRKTLLALPWLQSALPPFLQRCRSIAEFWQFIKTVYSTYAERRQYLDACFNPLLDILEEVEESSTQALVFGQEIGCGGFGAVYKVRHEHLDMDFAIKILAPAFDDGSRIDLDRFFREARILFSLHHPNVIRVYDVGLKSGRPFIRMEFFDGMTLSAVIRQRGSVPAGKAIAIARRVTDALRHAHEEAGVVHRDLKPSNVMIAKPEQLRVLDFGLGIFVEGDIVSRLTRTDQAAAAGPYTAPELYADPRLVDPRTDIYSIGALWYELLTGRPPVGADISGFLETSSHAPVSHRELVLQCLDSSERRFQSCSDLLSAIRGVEDGVHSRVRPLKEKTVGSI